MAHYIGVHQMTYFRKFDVLAGLHKGGTVLINAPWKTWEVRPPPPLHTSLHIYTHVPSWHIAVPSLHPRSCYSALVPPFPYSASHLCPPPKPLLVAPAQITGGRGGDATAHANARRGAATQALLPGRRCRGGRGRPGPSGEHGHAGEPNRRVVALLGRAVAAATGNDTLLGSACRPCHPPRLVLAAPATSPKTHTITTTAHARRPSLR